MLALANKFMTMTPESVVQGVSDLVSLPEVCVRVNEMVESGQYSAAEIGKVVGRDTGLTARLLRLANSPFYGFASRIDTVSRAVSVIGTDALRDLVIATSAAKTFKGLANDLVTMEDFWVHSIYCGLAARLLAAKAHLEQATSLFVAGLLHDVGQLVLYKKLPEQSAKALRIALEHPGETEAFAAERKVFGFDHADVGGALLRHWKLPARLAESIAAHHDPVRARSFPREAAVLHIANTLANMAEINSTDPARSPPIHAGSWSASGLTPSVIESVVRQVQTQFSEVQALLLSDRR